MAIFILTLFSLFLPVVWLLAFLLDGWKRSKYIISLGYLFISWTMVVLSFTVLIAVWKNQMAVRALLSEEFAAWPGWISTSYQLFDSLIGLFPSTDLIQAVVIALPLLLVPLARLDHLRQKNKFDLAFRYAALNIGYFGLTQALIVRVFGPRQIISLYALVITYLLVLFFHFYSDRYVKMMALEQQ